MNNPLVTFGESPTDSKNGEIKHYEWTFRFVEKDGVWFAQVWLTDAMFSVVKQGRFDSYVLKFKFAGKDNELPAGLERIIYGYFKFAQPVIARTQKDFRSGR